MMLDKTMTLDKLKPGNRVRVIQQIDRREGPWTAEVEGEIIEVLRAPTGSWYAHGSRDRYWLQRLKLRKDDGEVTLLSLDEDSRVFVLKDAKAET